MGNGDENSGPLGPELQIIIRRLADQMTNKKMQKILKNLEKIKESFLERFRVVIIGNIVAVFGKIKFKAGDWLVSLRVRLQVFLKRGQIWFLEKKKMFGNLRMPEFGKVTGFFARIKPKPREKKVERIAGAPVLRKVVFPVLEMGFYVALTAGLIWGIPKFLGRVLDTEYPIAVATSSSMWPALKEGDLVLVRGTSGDVLGVSDIAVYKHENGFAIHRVVRKREDTFIAKGDANTKEDAPVSYDQLVGRALTVGGKPLRIPMVGKLGSAVRAKVFNTRTIEQLSN